MFKKSLLAILCTVSMACADETHIGSITVRKDHEVKLSTKQDVITDGCVTTTKPDDNNLNRAVVVSYDSHSPCASLEITKERGNHAGSHTTTLTHRYIDNLKESTQAGNLLGNPENWIYHLDLPDESELLQTHDPTWSVELKQIRAK